MKIDEVQGAAINAAPCSKNMAFILLALICLSFMPSDSSAYDFSGDSGTYLRLYEDEDGERVYGLSEYLDLDYINDNLSIRTSGLLKTDFGDVEKTGEKLRYAYMALRRPSGAYVNLGRLYVLEGVAADKIDGICAGATAKGMGLSLFGGVPVETSFDDRGGDLMYGGRLRYGNGRYGMGASYLKEVNDEEDFRHEAGADYYLRPFEKAEVVGKSFYNIENSGWMRHSLYLTLKPTGALRFSGETSWVDYGNYFQSPTTTAFLSAPGIITDDGVWALGGEAEYYVTRTVSFAVDYKDYSYQPSGDADYYGGRISYSEPGRTAAGVSAHWMDGEGQVLGYADYRAYIFKKFGRPDALLDLMHTIYDRQVHGVRDAYAAVASAGYDFDGRLRVAGNIEWGRNPNFDDEFKGLIKLIFGFGIQGGKVKNER